MKFLENLDLNPNTRKRSKLIAARVRLAQEELDRSLRQAADFYLELQESGEWTIEEFHTAVPIVTVPWEIIKRLPEYADWNAKPRRKRFRA